MSCVFFVEGYGAHRDLPVLTHSFPTRRSSDLRGLANTEPMTAAMALRVGMAAGTWFTNGDHRHRVLIGKDTRLSGYMLEPALVAGFTGDRKSTRLNSSH